MDNEDADRSNFTTPLVTLHISDQNTAEEHPDSHFLFPPSDYQQHMDDLSTHINVNYPSNNNDYENENDQQATEATDDSIHPNQLQKDPVETTIDISFNPQPSHDRDDIRSPVQETEPSEENFSGVIPDIDNINVTKVSDPSAIYSESVCVPYTDEKDEISTIKQTLTTITTEYIEPKKKDKNNIGHIMISYNHSTEVLCYKIAQELKNLNYDVWIDQDNIRGNVLGAMAHAVENAFVVLMAINEQYYTSRYCRLEAEYSVENNKAYIPMLMQSDYKASGWLGIIKGSKLHIDFTKFPFNVAFNTLVREIEEIRNSLGGGGENDRTIISTYVNHNQCITTMDNSWKHYQNIPTWSSGDVIEWLNREKLDVFQNALTGFTGSTLWQLYKMKLEVASHYHQTVDSLLPPTFPLRLFYILTFNGALESLFSSLH